MRPPNKMFQGLDFATYSNIEEVDAAMCLEQADGRAMELKSLFLERTP